MAYMSNEKCKILLNDIFKRTKVKMCRVENLVNMRPCYTDVQKCRSCYFLAFKQLAFNYRYELIELYE